MSNQSSPGAVGAPGLPAAWIVGGVLAVASLAAAATYAFRQDVAPPAKPVAQAAPAPVEATPARLAEAPRAADKTVAAAPAAARRRQSIRPDRPRPGRDV